MDNTDKKTKTIQITIINKLGEFQFDPITTTGGHLGEIIESFRLGNTNFSGKIKNESIIIPARMIQESILKYKEIK